MSKKVLTASVIAVLLFALGSAVAIWYHPAFAKSPPKKEAPSMAKYSAPNKTHTKVVVRKSRLKQMNILGEAATVLNVLPITIMDEMKKGKTLGQIAKDKGMSETEFTNKVADLEKKMINAEVKAGTIPQKHADAINAGRSDRLKKSLKLKSVNVNDHAAMDMGN